MSAAIPTPLDSAVSPETSPGAPLASSPSASPDLIDLSSGNELSEAGALKFAASRPVRLIVLAGPVKGGKTTLLTALYELFQWKPVSGQNFSGSITLPGLERRCHLARTASGNLKPDTQRTVYKGPEPVYLHLRATAANGFPTTADYLFTDVSGEMFDHASNSQSECLELLFLKRAAHFVILLDCERAMTSERWAMIQQAKTLLQSCIDNDMLSSFCFVTIVWSKIDFQKAASTSERKTLIAFRKEVEREFTASFAGRVNFLKVREIAARPVRAPSMGFGKGVEELFGDWVTHYPQSKPLELLSQIPAGIRESELYARTESPDIKT